MKEFLLSREFRFFIYGIVTTLLLFSLISLKEKKLKEPTRYEKILQERAVESTESSQPAQ